MQIIWSQYCFRWWFVAVRPQAIIWDIGDDQCLYYHMVTLVGNGLACSVLRYQLISPWTQWPPFWQTTFSNAFFNENDKIPIQLLLKRVPKSPIDNKPVWWPSSLTHVCGTLGRWVIHMDFSILKTKQASKACVHKLNVTKPWTYGLWSSRGFGRGPSKPFG